METIREKQVLAAIIDYYLKSGEAVGSRTLVEEYSLDCSSATIRNVMADLEAGRFIEKVYTSSGRAPTSKGFKYYIDYLLEVQRPGQKDLKSIKQAYANNQTELSGLLSNSTDILSQMTTYAGVALEPNVSQEKLQKIELIYLNEESFIAVIVTDTSVKTKRVVLNRGIQESELKGLAEHMNNVFQDQLIGNILLAEDSSQPINNEIAVLQQCLSSIENKVHMKGSASLFDHLVAENANKQAFQIFQAKDEMKSFLEGIVEKGKVDKNKVNIVLGEELQSEKLKDLSFVFSSYDFGNTNGVVGVIGPKRMEYSKVAGVVEQVAKQVNSVRSKDK